MKFFFILFLFFKPIFAAEKSLYDVRLQEGGKVIKTLFEETKKTLQKQKSDEKKEFKLNHLAQSPTWITLSLAHDACSLEEENGVLKDKNEHQVSPGVYESSLPTSEPIPDFSIARFDEEYPLFRIGWKLAQYWFEYLWGVSSAPFILSVFNFSPPTHNSRTDSLLDIRSLLDDEGALSPPTPPSKPQVYFTTTQKPHQSQSFDQWLWNSDFQQDSFHLLDPDHLGLQILFILLTQSSAPPENYTLLKKGNSLLLERNEFDSFLQPSFQSIRAGENQTAGHQFINPHIFLLLPIMNELIPHTVKKAFSSHDIHSLLGYWLSQLSSHQTQLDEWIETHKLKQPIEFEPPISRAQSLGFNIAFHPETVSQILQNHQHMSSALRDPAVKTYSDLLRKVHPHVATCYNHVHQEAPRQIQKDVSFIKTEWAKIKPENSELSELLSKLRSELSVKFELPHPIEEKIEIWLRELSIPSPHSAIAEILTLFLQYITDSSITSQNAAYKTPLSWFENYYSQAVVQKSWELLNERDHPLIWEEISQTPPPQQVLPSYNCGPAIDQVIDSTHPLISMIEDWASFTTLEQFFRLPIDVQIELEKRSKILQPLVQKTRRINASPLQTTCQLKSPLSSEGAEILFHHLWTRNLTLNSEENAFLKTVLSLLFSPSLSQQALPYTNKPLPPAIKVALLSQAAPLLCLQWVAGIKRIDANFEPTGWKNDLILPNILKLQDYLTTHLSPMTLFDIATELWPDDFLEQQDFIPLNLSSASISSSDHVVPLVPSASVSSIPTPPSPSVPLTKEATGVADISSGSDQEIPVFISEASPIPEGKPLAYHEKFLLKMATQVLSMVNPVDYPEEILSLILETAHNCEMILIGFSQLPWQDLSIFEKLLKSKKMKALSFAALLKTQNPYCSIAYDDTKGENKLAIHDLSFVDENVLFMMILSHFPHTTHLSFANNGIESFKPLITSLQQFQNLTTLCVHTNPVHNAGPLSSVKSLTSLTFKGTYMPIGDLGHLKTLYPGSFSKITNFSSNEPILFQNLGHGAFQNFSPPHHALCSLEHLAETAWDKTLKAKPKFNMDELLAFLAQHDVRPSVLKLLFSLHHKLPPEITASEISFIPLEATTLQNPANLKRLTISRKEPSKVSLPESFLSSLNQFSGITHLTLAGVSLKKLHPLPSLLNLTNLDVHNNQITSISGLFQGQVCKYPALTVLNLSGNSLKDNLETLNQMPLTELYLHDNQITGLPSLGNLTLTKLDIRNNCIPSSQLINHKNTKTLFFTPQQEKK